MSKLSAADIGKGDMTDWMADIYEAKMQKAKAELEEKVSILLGCFLQVKLPPSIVYSGRLFSDEPIS